MQQPTHNAKPRLGLAIKAVLPVIVVLLGWWAFMPENNTSIRQITLDDLNGTWRTRSPKYAHRFLQFGDQMVTFGQGEAGTATYFVDDIACEANDGEAVLVRISYSDLDSNAYQISFYYADRKGGTIWMKNQSGVHWSRTISTLSQSVHHPYGKVNESRTARS